MADSPIERRWTIHFVGNPADTGPKNAGVEGPLVDEFGESVEVMPVPAEGDYEATRLLQEQREERLLPPQGYYMRAALDEQPRPAPEGLREALERVREAGGRMYPGSPPGRAANLREYQAALDTLGIPHDAWQTWLDALDAYTEALAASPKPSGYIAAGKVYHPDDVQVIYPSGPAGEDETDG